MHVHLSIKSATKVLALIVIMVSMSACQNNPQQQAAMPTPAKPAISPGTINLTVQILECSEREVRSLIVYDCKTSVVSVQEYGASTTQLPPTTNIGIRFSESILATHPPLEKGSELSLTIGASRDTKSDSSAPPWVAISLF